MIETVYKFTHAQAVVSGDLIQLDSKSIPIYVTKDACAAFIARKETLEQVRDRAKKLWGMTSSKNMRPGHHVQLTDKTELVWSNEVRDDDRIVLCLTIAMKGEL